MLGTDIYMEKIYTWNFGIYKHIIVIFYKELGR